MKVAVVGANGQLGADVVLAFRQAGDEVVPLDHEDVEVSDESSVVSALSNASPDLVVNTAAMHNIEKCELDPARAFAVNALGTRFLAQACEASGSAFVHVSTDYVFGGEKRSPYVETDPPRPLNTYGISKLAGEHYALCENRKTFVVRTSAVYGSHPCRAKGGDNFVRLMLRLGRERGKVKVVADEFVSPTYTVDIANQIVRLASTDAFGLYHATSAGQCTWNEFARAIFEEAGLDVVTEVATAADFPAKVPRPAYSVLDNRAFRERGLDVMPTWQEALKRYISALRQEERLPSELATA
ncbi:MAG: dTDP-4-dehydrorhamnose reductase [Gemmatimonadaceae bacterium]|nr:dTDP-4-dehydrorhamnose reductase [Gemmatimonadaceae bacterium]